MALLRPLMMQAASGDTVYPVGLAYSAQEHRQLVAVAVPEGVVDVDDFRVSQRAAGANFTVDVAAGRAVVIGDDVAYQGGYLVTNDATLTGKVIPPAPGSGSRTHRVVLKILDKAHDGSLAYGDYDADVQVLEDTGAGTPALPDSAITLALVTVTSATGSITNANISTELDVRKRSGSAARARIRKTADTTALAAGTSGTNTYQSVMFDNDGMADLANNRLVCRTPGVYMLASMARVILASAAAERAIQILVNGMVVVHGGWTGFNGPLTVAAPWPLEVGDVVTTRTYASTGTYQLLGTDVAASDNTFLSATQTGRL